jgi:Flp pilus assembly protein TadD
VLEVDPRNVSARHNLGTVYLYQQRFAEAVVELRKVVEESPGYGRSYTNLGVALLSSGRAEEAVEVLETAVELLPGDFESHYTMAAAYAEGGMEGASRRAVARALEINPSEPRALALQQHVGVPESPAEPAAARAAVVAEAPEHRATAFSQAAEQKPMLPAPRRRPGAPEPFPGPGAEPEPESDPIRAEAEALFRQGTGAFERGDLRKAERDYRGALELDPMNPNLHNNIGAVYLKQGRRDDAMKEFRQALALDPEHAKARVNLGAALYETGHGEEGLQLLEEARAQDPDNPEVLYRLSLILAHAGEVDRARSLVERVLQIDPFHNGARALQATMGSVGEPVYVAEPEIFLRKGAGSGYPVIGTAEYGQQFYVVEQRNEWFRVRRAVDGMEGWVLVQVLTREKPGS